MPHQDHVLRFRQKRFVEAVADQLLRHVLEKAYFFARRAAWVAQHDVTHDRIAVVVLGAQHVVAVGAAFAGFAQKVRVQRFVHDVRVATLRERVHPVHKNGKAIRNI